MGPTHALILRLGNARWSWDCGWPAFAARTVARWRTSRLVTGRWNAPLQRLATSRLGRLAATLAEAERGRFVLWLPVFMAAGVLLYYDLRFEPPAWIGAKFAA